LADNAERHAGGATVRTYLSVWGGLLAFTALTVASASLGLGWVGILVVLAIAAAKSSLIAAYFMHLRYERVRLFVAFVLIALAALTVFVGLTISDVAARREF
jgi:cytochrome c oxidase subunit 4